MGLLDRLPFFGGRERSSKKNMEVYHADLGEFKQTYVTELRDKIIEDLGYSDVDVNTRIWDGTQGVEVTPQEGGNYRISLDKEGRLTLRIPRDHPDKDRAIEEVQNFFHKELVQEK